MGRLVPAEAGRKKRGRPRQYATAQDKTDANVKQRRAKRQKEISEQRNKQHADFYGVGLPSVLPPIPNQVSGVMGFPIRWSA
ncbi:putative inactive purple acid phosphatase 16 [Fusarium oxysporum f. sp. albedinis]|nr:putative inactive purple acid phosphatase 16 [Fusarium oxysporum f. sp. albedinis]